MLVTGNQNEIFSPRITVTRNKKKEKKKKNILKIRSFMLVIGNQTEISLVDNDYRQSKKL